MVWYGMVVVDGMQAMAVYWYTMVWCGRVWYGTVQYSMVWYGAVCPFQQ